MPVIDAIVSAPSRAWLLLGKGTKLDCVDDESIRALVIRLSRADGSGGDTIERAAILADGSDLGGSLRNPASETGCARKINKGSNRL